jgi:hypothetical protein
LKSGDWQQDFNIEAVRSNGINFEKIFETLPHKIF